MKGVRAVRTHDKAVAGRPEWAKQWLVDWGFPHLHVGELGGTTWEHDRPQPRVPVWGTKALMPLAIKSCRVCGGRRNSQPHRRVC